MRAAGKKQRRRTAIISARLSGPIRLEAHPDGNVAARFDDGHSVGLGKYSAGAVHRAQALREGIPFHSFASDGSNVEKEIDLLVRRLARHGLVEYAYGLPRNDQVVIEPQLPDYWPRAPKLAGADVIVLSRFAYLRRRGNEMVLESPRAGALFRICDLKLATALARLSTPQRISKLPRQQGAPGLQLLALLLDCQIVFKVDAGDSLRLSEGDDALVLWDFHDMLFHTHSTEGRQANPLGGVYPYADVMAPPPPVRPRWPGKKIDLRTSLGTPSEGASPFATLLRERHSSRSFDDQQPITLAEVSRFLDATARVQSRWKSRLELGDGSRGPVIAYAARPYPSGGSSYELELYLAVASCKGLARGFYHYDAGRHVLVPITVRPHELEALLKGAEFAMDAPAAPQIVITIAARFGRTSWKYSSIAYSLILKDVGVLLQTLYLMATDMGLGGCAIGSINIDLFAKMTGIQFHVEGPVGQFALGRVLLPGSG